MATHPPLARMTPRRALLLFLILCAAYTVTYDFRPITDTDLNSLQTRSLALHGDIDLARYDHEDGYLTDRGGHRYSVYGIGVSIPVVPIYAVLIRLGAGESVLQGAASIPFAAAAVVAFLWLASELLERRWAVCATIMFAFGTTLWTIAATGFWQQAPAILLVILGWRAAISTRPRSHIYAGLALGSATVIRPTLVIATLVVGLYLTAHDRRALGRFIVGGIGPALFYAVSNRWIFGSFTTSGYSFAGVGFDGDMQAMGPQLFGWWRGLFVYSPALLLGLVGSVIALRQRDDRERILVFIGLSALIPMLFYVKWSTWFSGYNLFGYRYLLEVAPALCILGAFAEQRVSSVRAVATASGVVSVLTMVAGSRHNRFGWDSNNFAATLASSPIGQAWIDAIDHPLDLLWRLVVIVAVGALLWRYAPGNAPVASG
jgi:hypothetical protein